MKGTVLKPEYMKEGVREKRFLEAWQDDAHTAFRNMLACKFLEFDCAGRGNEYWTPVGHILRGGLIPRKEYEIVAIDYMEKNPFTKETWSAYEQILQENVSTVSEWVLHNFERLNMEILTLRRNPFFQNIARKAHQCLIYNIATAPSRHIYRDFLREYWYSRPEWAGPVFKAAFCIEGKYGKEADKAISFFIKICRKLIGNARREYRDTLKCCNREDRPIYDENRAKFEKNAVGDVYHLLAERFNMFPKPWVKLSPEEEEAATRRWREIDAKIERIIVSQCARCPL